MPFDDLMTRQATFRPSSLDRENRRVRVTVSTGADVQRRGYLEKLTLPDPQTIVGLPVLNSHRQDNLDNLVGRVIAAGLDSAGLWADVQISQRADWLLDEIEAGIINSASIGYTAARVDKSTDPATGQAVRTITPAISEISFVPVPADKGATTRQKGNPMPETVVENPGPDQAEIAPPAEVRSLVRAAGLEAEVADQIVEAGVSMTRAREEILSELQRRHAAKPIIRVHGGSSEDPQVRLRRRQDALYSRITGEAPPDDAREFVGYTLRDHARAGLDDAGQSTRGILNTEEMIRAAHTTSDFSQLLTGTGNRMLASAYQNAQCQLKTSVSRRATIGDFRPKTVLKLSDVGLLQRVSESGEIKHTTRGEASEAYKLDTYASLFGLSLQAQVNDDLGAFRDWAQSAGRMSAETENNLVFELLLSNPQMGEDSKAMFHADHGNLADTGAALDVGTLAAARQAMRNQKGLDGSTPINATPKFLLVGPQLETAAEQLLASVYAATVEDANPFTGRLTLLVDPRITDQRWYVFADPSVITCLEYAYLSGRTGPQMSSREGWEVLGQEFRVVLHFGCGALDFRGAYLNGGAGS